MADHVEQRQWNSTRWNGTYFRQEAFKHGVRRLRPGAAQELVIIDHVCQNSVGKKLGAERHTIDRRDHEEQIDLALVNEEEERVGDGHRGAPHDPSPSLTYPLEHPQPHGLEQERKD